MHRLDELRPEPALYPADPDASRRVEEADRIAEGTVGGETPNAADLQIGSSIAMLNTHRDLRSLLDGRPTLEVAIRQFSDFPGHMPEGTIPGEWIPAGTPA